MSRSKKPSDEDLALWLNLVKDIEKLPYSTEKVRHHVPMRINSHVIQERRNQEYLQRQVISPVQDQDYSGISKQMRIRNPVIEARLDLHGYTQAQALTALQSFLQKAQLNGWIWVLVITGKGRPDQETTLKQQVPKWLNSLPQVSGYAVAKPQDGGNGALYVRVKRSSSQANKQV